MTGSRGTQTLKKGEEGGKSYLSLSNKYTHIHTHAQRIFALQRNFVQLSVGSRVHASRRRPPPNGGNFRSRKVRRNAETSDSTARAFSSCGGGVRDPAPRVFASHFARVGHVAAAGSADPWTRKDAVGE